MNFLEKKMTNQVTHSNKMNKQSERLKYIREVRGFSSARKACQHFKWNYNSYIQHELGLRSLARSAKKYAEGYQISEAWLLTGDGSFSPDLSEEEKLLEAEFRRFLHDSGAEEKKMMLNFLKAFSSSKS